MKKPRLSLKQLLGTTAVASVVAFCLANYDSFYGIAWTPADAARLKAELADLDGEIDKWIAIRVAIDAVVAQGGWSRALPSDARRGVWTRIVEKGDQVETEEVDCYLVFLDDVPSGVFGAFTRFHGGHALVYVGLDGSVLRVAGGA